MLLIIYYVVSALLCHPGSSDSQLARASICRSCVSKHALFSIRSSQDL